MQGDSVIALLRHNILPILMLSATILLAWYAGTRGSENRDRLDDR